MLLFGSTQSTKSKPVKPETRHSVIPHPTVSVTYIPSTTGTCTYLQYGSLFSYKTVWFNLLEIVEFRNWI